MFRFAQGTKVSLADVVDDANLKTVPTPASDLRLIHFKLVKWINSSKGKPLTRSFSSEDMRELKILLNSSSSSSCLLANRSSRSSIRT